MALQVVLENVLADQVLETQGANPAAWIAEDFTVRSGLLRHLSPPATVHVVHSLGGALEIL
jgi:hypothetical protein